MTDLTPEALDRLDALDTLVAALDPDTARALVSMARQKLTLETIARQVLRDIIEGEGTPCNACRDRLERALESPMPTDPEIQRWGPKLPQKVYRQEPDMPNPLESLSDADVITAIRLAEAGEPSKLDLRNCVALGNALLAERELRVQAEARAEVAKAENIRLANAFEQSEEKSDSLYERATVAEMQVQQAIGTIEILKKSVDHWKQSALAAEDIVRKLQER